MKTVTFKKFQSDESGAMTADWVVLTGAIIGISFGIKAVTFSFLGAAEAKINRDLANNDFGRHSKIVD